jgi:hypothetical protein
VVGGAWLLAVLLGFSAAVRAHPAHTSSAELVQRDDSVRVAIRVFADDIAEAGALLPYLKERFGLEDARGKPIVLLGEGAVREGDVLVIRLRGRVPAGLAGARLRNGVLTDRFADQVNVVRAAYGGRTATLIFTRGDGPKALP